MKIVFKAFLVATLSLALAPSARAAESDIVGKWKGQFDSQIGLQKYTFEFKVETNKLTGKAIGEREMGTNDVALAELKLDKDEITFVEPFTFGDNELRIEYKGKISGDEIKFHRKVGDVAEEDFVAKRVKAGDAKSGSSPSAKPEATPTTNSPAGKQ